MVPFAAIQAVPIAVIAWYRLHRYAWYRYSAIVNKAFDFDKEGNWNGYMPTLLYGKNVPYEYLEGGNVIYWDLVDNPLCKQLDWGSWGLKRTAKNMVLFLEQYKDNKYAKYLIGNIKVDFIDNGLEDVELVLEAVET